MLETQTILEYNLDAYKAILGEDIKEDIYREFYRAYGVVDENEKAVGAMVYELCDAEDEDENIKSKIRFLKADSDEALDALQNVYRDEGVYGDQITASSYWLEDEKSALSCERAEFSKEQKENETIFITLQDAANISYVARKKKIPDYILSIDDISIAQFHHAIKDSLFSGRKGIVEDLGYLEKEWFENTISACTITDDKVSGLFLLRLMPSGIIEPILLVAWGPDSNKHLAYMIAYSIQTASEIYPLTTKIKISRTRDEIIALVDKLLPGAKGDIAYFGSRKEE